MLIRWLPLLIGLVPLVGVHAAYLIAVDYGYLPPCIPYLDGCTSISGTGRYPPASFLFKAVEMAIAAALPVFWYFSVKWLRALAPDWHALSATNEALSSKLKTSVTVNGPSDKYRVEKGGASGRNSPWVARWMTRAVSA
jgi:hypothetical protein